MDETIKTSDVVLASVLECKGYELSHVEKDPEDFRGQRKIWVFFEYHPDTMEDAFTATEIKEQYRAKDIIVEPYEFFVAMRKVKMYLHEA